MDLVELQIFKTVAEQGGITKAAAALHRVQSNVTTRVKQLEDRVGAKLFHRQGRRLVLYSEGKVLLAYADRLLRLSAEAQAAIKGHGPHGVFKLGTLESTAATRLPPVLARYHRGYPAVRLELVAGTSGALVDRVLRGEIEAAFVAEPFAETNLEAQHAFTEELVLNTPTRRRCSCGAPATARRRSTRCAKSFVEDPRRRLHLRAARGQAHHRRLRCASQECTAARTRRAPRYLCGVRSAAGASGSLGRRFRFSVQSAARVGARPRLARCLARPARPLRHIRSAGVAQSARCLSQYAPAGQPLCASRHRRAGRLVEPDQAREPARGAHLPRGRPTRARLT